MRRRTVAVIAVIVFFAITFGVFYYTPPSRPWWLTVGGFFCFPSFAWCRNEIFNNDSLLAAIVAARTDPMDDGPSRLQGTLLPSVLRRIMTDSRKAGALDHFSGR